MAWKRWLESAWQLACGAVNHVYVWVFSVAFAGLQAYQTWGEGWLSEETARSLADFAARYSGRAMIVVGVIAMAHAYHELRMRKQQSERELVAEKDAVEQRLTREKLALWRRLQPKLVITFGTGRPYYLEIALTDENTSAVVGVRQWYRVGLANAGGETVTGCRVYLEDIEPGGGGYLPAFLALMNSRTPETPPVDVEPSGERPVRFFDVVSRDTVGALNDHVAWQYGFPHATQVHRLPQESVEIVLRATGNTPQSCFRRFRVTLTSGGHFAFEPLGECWYGERTPQVPADEPGDA